MDPFLNPYAPGAGAQPPELAGRDELLAKASVALRRIATGRFGRSLILTGLRGVGKTVLLNRIRQEVEAEKIIAVRIEVAEKRSLPSLLAPSLKAAILKLDRGKAAANVVTRGLKALSVFVKAMKVKYQDIEIGLDIDAPSDSTLSANLDDSLSQLFQVVGKLAREKGTAIVFFIDEIHVLDSKQLASLIVALHLAAQDSLPLTLVAAGLPQLPSQMGEAKTYAERLFEFHHIGKLDKDAAKRALVVPVEKLKVTYTEDALEEIIRQTEGYAYFLQEWGKHAWDIAHASCITLEDAKRATIEALADLDASFFRVRLEQLTPIQKRYLRAMAELGAGPHGSGQIAALLHKQVTSLAPVRDQLISKGLIYSPLYGETAFTVPLFDSYIKRMVSEF